MRRRGQKVVTCEPRGVQNLGRRQEQGLHHRPRGAHPADTPALDFRPAGCEKVRFCDLNWFAAQPQEMNTLIIGVSVTDQAGTKPADPRVTENVSQPLRQDVPGMCTSNKPLLETPHSGGGVCPWERRPCLTCCLSGPTRASGVVSGNPGAYLGSFLSITTEWLPSLPLQISDLSSVWSHPA